MNDKVDPIHTLTIITYVFTLSGCLWILPLTGGTCPTILNNAKGTALAGIAHIFGKKLLNMMIDESLKHNVKKVTLEVRKDSSAISFYRKLNFSSVDILPCYYQDGCDGIVMEKQI